MGKFMRQPANANDTMTCPNCLADGKEIEIHGEPHSRDVGKFQWKNPDGSSHIGTPEMNFAHVVPNAQSTFNEAQNVSKKFREDERREFQQKAIKGASEAFEQKILAHKAKMEQDGSVENYMAFYHALRRMFESDMPIDIAPAVRGVIVGNMISNYIAKPELTVPYIPQTSSETDVKTSNTHYVETSIVGNEVIRATSHTSALEDLKEYDLVKEGTLDHTLFYSFPDWCTVEQKVRWIRANYPNFSDDISANEKVEIYMKCVYDISMPKLPIALETITREFRFQSETKKTELEQKKREEYIDRQCQAEAGGTIERGLLLD